MAIVVLAIVALAMLGDFGVCGLAQRPRVLIVLVVCSLLWCDGNMSHVMHAFLCRTVVQLIVRVHGSNTMMLSVIGPLIEVLTVMIWLFVF